MYLSILLLHWQSTRDENWTMWCGYVWREMHVYIYLTGSIIWLMSCFLTANNRPAFQWNMDTYGGRYHIYLLQLCIWLIFTVSLISMTTKYNHLCHHKYRFCYLLRSNPYVSICTFWTKIQGYHLTRFVWHTRIIFLFFYYVEIVYLLQRREDVGMCWNQLQLGLTWSSRVTNVIKYYLWFQITNLESRFSISLKLYIECILWYIGLEKVFFDIVLEHHKSWIMSLGIF